MQFQTHCSNLICPLYSLIVLLVSATETVLDFALRWKKSHFLSSDLNRVKALMTTKRGEKDDVGEDYDNHLNNDDITKGETMTMINNVDRAVFKWLSKEITWLRLLRIVIGLKDSRKFFNQWEAKTKPIPPCTRDFSRASSELQVIASNGDCCIAPFVPLVIGRSNCFGFGFSTVMSVKTALILHLLTMRKKMLIVVPHLPVSPNRPLSIYTSVCLRSKFVLSYLAYEVAKNMLSYRFFNVFLKLL